MKKPQPRTAQSSKVEPRKANRGDEQQSAAGRTIEAVDVAAIPIEDPFHEKSLAEIDPNKLLFYLCRGKGFGAISRHDLRSRIIEVYRRCYEQSPAKQEGVLRDFVASFPHLVFEAKWLRTLAEQHVYIPEFEPSAPRNRFFLAIANGFRAAAAPAPRFFRSVRDGAQQTAQYFRREILAELKQWDKTLDRRMADDTDPLWRAELAQRAAAKTEELIQKYQRIKPHQEEITRLLCEGEHYEASVLIASKLMNEWFHVSARDLERDLY